MVNQLLQIIKSQIATANSATHAAWCEKIIEENLSIDTLFQWLLVENPPISNRTTWLLGGLSSKKSDYAPQITRFLFKHFDDIKVHDLDRVLAKQCMLCGDNLPEEIEGELVNRLFDFALQPKRSKSTKHYALKALDAVFKKYPALKIEFELMEKE